MKISEILPTGKENAITAKDLSSILGISTREVSRKIEEERRKGTPICASCYQYKGYYLAADDDELQEYCKRLRHRETEIAKTRESIST